MNLLVIDCRIGLFIKQAFIESVRVRRNTQLPCKDAEGIQEKNGEEQIYLWPYLMWRDFSMSVYQCPVISSIILYQSEFSPL